MNAGTTSTTDAWPEIPKDAQGRLVSVASVCVPYHGVLRVLWTDGVERNVDMSHTFDATYRLAAQLADPDVFATAHVSEAGAVEWANGMDICPHALRLKADDQHAGRAAAAE